MTKRTVFLFAMVLSLCGYAGLAQEAGLILYEVNSPPTGTVSASWTALAEDASIAFTNLAGMPRLDKSQLMVCADAFAPGS